MRKGIASPVVACLTALCLVVQSVGAAVGGFVCIGCPNTVTGVALASAPCSAIDSCCSDSSASDSTAADALSESCWDGCTDHEQHSSDQDCGCVDISLPASAGAMWSPIMKDALTLTAYVNVLATVAALDGQIDESPRLMWTVRGGPPLVRTLAPSSRRTVLLI